MWRLLFGIDVRSLALFRVCLSVVMLYDLWVRVWDLPAHMTDSGVILRSTSLKFYNYLTPGLFNIDGTVLFAYFLFFVTFISTLSFFVGYRTKLNTVLLYILFSSIQTRNLRIGNGGDKFLRHILLWSIFVPLHAVFSVDSLFETSKNARNNSLFLTVRHWRQILRFFQLQCFENLTTNNNFDSKQEEKWLHVSFGSFALLFQTVSMYVITWYLKNGVEWTTTYYAVYLTLCVNAWVTPLGLALRQIAEAFPMAFEGLRFVTFITPYLQIGTVFLFCPIYTSQLRILLILALAGFQIGLGLCLDVLCVFPWASLAGSLVFVPPCVWEIIGKKLPPLSSAEKEKLVTNKQTEEKKTVGENINVNTSPYLLSPSSSWRSTSIFSNIMCVLFITMHTACFLEQLRAISLPNFVLHLEFALQASQDWTMFSNNLGSYDGWYSMPTRFVHNGTLIDLAPSFADLGIPLLVPAADRVVCFPTNQELGPLWQCDLLPQGAEKQHSKRFSGRWLELLNNNKPWTDPALFDFTDYLCRIWNNNRPFDERIALFEILYVQRRIAVFGPGHPEEEFPGEGWALLEKREFASHNITIKTKSTRLCETRCQNVAPPNATQQEVASHVAPPK